MIFSTFLQENSLFGGDTGVNKTDVLNDVEKIMNSLIFNFFGFLGLVQLNNISGFLRTYQQNDKSGNINSISDEGNDVSVAIKLALDADYIKSSVAVKMMKILQEIRQKKIDSNNFDDSRIKSLLDEIKYTTHKPNQRVLMLLKDYHSGVISLSVFTKRLYLLAKQKDFVDETQEFRNLVVKGQYLKLFANISDAELNTSIIVNVPIVEIKPLDDMFFRKAVSISNEKEYDLLLAEYGITSLDNHQEEVDTWIRKTFRSLGYGKTAIGFNVSIDFDTCPAFNSDPGKQILIRLIDNEISAYINSKNVDGFISKLRSFDESARDLYLSLGFVGKPVKRDIIVAGKILIQRFFETRVETCGNSSTEIDQLRVDAEFLFNCLQKYTKESDESVRSYAYTLLWGFSKRMVFGLIADIVDIALIKPSSKGLINFEIVDGRVVILANNYNESEEIKTLMDLLIMHDFGVIKQISVDVVELYFEMFKLLVGNNLKINSISTSVALSNSDYDKLLTMIKKSLSFKEIGTMISYYMFFVVEHYKSNHINSQTTIGIYADWWKLSRDIIFDLLRTGGYIIDGYELLHLITHSFTGRGAIIAIETNFNYFKNTIEALDEDILRDIFTYMDEGDVIRVMNWLIKLQNTGKINSKTIGLPLQIVEMSSNISMSFVKINSSDQFFEFMEQYDYDDYLENDYLKDYIAWLLNDKDIKSKVIAYFESATIKQMKPKSIISINLLIDADITDKMLINLRTNVWPKMTHDDLDNVGKKYTVDKIKTAFYKFLSEIKTDDIRHLFLQFAPAKEFNAEINDMVAVGQDVQAKLITDAGTNPDKKLLLLFKSMNNNRDLIDNIESDVLIEILKLGKQLNKMDDLFNFARKMKSNDEKKIDVIINELSVIDSEIKNALVEYLIGAELGIIASKAIFRDDIPIKPYQQLTEARIGEILKYNKIVPDKTNVANVFSCKDINKIAINAAKHVDKVFAQEVKESQEYFDRKSIEYDFFNEGKHGSIGPKILREFDVRIPKQADAYDAYVKENPDIEIMDPVFHGTGSIAASMILRYGFAVINSTDASVVARMLGNGIYFSTVIDKVSQYTSDEGFTRGIGNKGYIFRMKAALGEKGKDYKSAGIEGATYKGKTVSPEWSVFHPEKQLNIYKAFEVELTFRDDIKALKDKYNMNESTAIEIKTFKEFFRESMTITYKEATTYTFIDGQIPISSTESIDFEQFEPNLFGDHVRLEFSQLGPMLIIEHNGSKSQAFCVRYTDEFMDQPEFKQYLKLIGV